MRIQKTDGLYRKRQLTAHSKVPLALWLSIVLILAGVVVLFALRTQLIIGEAIPNQPVVRKASWRVAVVGDIACNVDSPNYNSGQGLVDACRMKNVGERLERENLDALLLVGDLQYPNGTFEDYERSFVPYFREVRADVYAVPGNHDYGQGNIDGYKKAFQQYFPNAVYGAGDKSFYDFGLGSWRAYALDSNCDYVGGCGALTEQYDWLTSKLTSVASKCSVAFWYHPIYSSGIHGSEPERANMLAIWSALQATGTDIVLNGHDHHYERFARMTADGVPSGNGIREFVVGTGGHSLRKAITVSEGSEKIIDNSFGYLYLELFAGRYEWQFKDVDGQVLDQGSDECR